jgi:plastocyanin
MQTSSRFFPSILIILLAAATLTACRTSGQTSTACGTEPGICISITDNACPAVTVAAGDQVTWVNEGEQEHLVQVETSEGEAVFDSGELQPGDSAAFTFSQAGSYAYLCSLEPELSGMITVEP